MRTVPNRQKELDELREMVFGPNGWDPQVLARPLLPQSTSPSMGDTEIIDKASRAANGAKFDALWRGDTSGYESESEADLALLSILAFYTQNEIQLDSLYRRSGLYRDKWGRDDYARRTIKKALARDETYTTSLNGDGVVAENPITLHADEDDDRIPYEEGARLRFSTMQDMLERVPDAPEAIMAPYAYRGSSSGLIGPPGSLKTHLVLGLFAARERGEERYLGVPIKLTGTALLLSEEGVYTLKGKQFSLGMKGCDVEVLRRDQVIGWPWEEICAQSIERCVERGHDLLVIDPMSKWLGLAGESENHAGAVNAALAPLQDATRRGISVWILHHSRKGGGEHGEAARGSNALQAAVDVFTEIAHLTKDDHGPRTLKVSKTRYSELPPTLGITFVDGHFDVTTDIASLKRGETKENILEFLADGKRRPADEIASAINRTIYTTRGHLNELLDAGALQRTGRGSGDSPYLFWVEQ